MKKLWVILALSLFLAGCGSKQTFETVDDVQAEPVIAQIKEVHLALPEEAAVPAMENTDGEKLYLCNGFALMVQTMDGGDLGRTLRQLTGFEKEQLAVMQTEQSGVIRYDCVWTTAGEAADQVCRAAILDDGSYHYAITVMSDFSAAGDLSETWRTILDSVSLSTD